MAFTPTSIARPLTLSGVVKREIDPEFSYKEITIASGAGVLKLGTVLGQVTATKKYVLQDPAAADGSQNAMGVLCESVDATLADSKALAGLWGLFLADENLTYKVGITAPQKAAVLAALELRQILIQST